MSFLKRPKFGAFCTKIRTFWNKFRTKLYLVSCVRQNCHFFLNYFFEFPPPPSIRLIYLFYLALYASFPTSQKVRRYALLCF